MINARENEAKKHAIFTACENLKNKGINVTNDNIGQELLSLGWERGSNTTLSKYKQAWFAQNQSELTETLLNPRPDKLTQIIDDIRIEAKREAQAEYEKLKIDLESKMTEMQETLSYAQAETQQKHAQCESLAASLEQATKKLATTTEEKQTLVQKLQEETLRHDHTKMLYDKLAESSKVEMATLTQRFDLLISSQEKISNRHADTVNELMHSQEKQRHKFIADIDSLKVELNKMTVINESAKLSLLQTQAENKHLKQLCDSHKQLTKDMQTSFKEMFALIENITQPLTKQLLAYQAQQVENDNEQHLAIMHLHKQIDQLHNMIHAKNTVKDKSKKA